MRLHTSGKPVRRWSNDERDRAVELYDGGLRVDEVARLLGRPYSSTRTILSGFKVTRTPIETRRMRGL